MLMGQMWGTRGVRDELQVFGLKNWKAGCSPAGGGRVQAEKIQAVRVGRTQDASFGHVTSGCH